MILPCCHHQPFRREAEQIHYCSRSNLASSWSPDPCPHGIHKNNIENRFWKMRQKFINKKNICAELLCVWFFLLLQDGTGPRKPLEEIWVKTARPIAGAPCNAASSEGTHTWAPGRSWSQSDSRPEDSRFLAPLLHAILHALVQRWTAWDGEPGLPKSGKL